MLTTVKPDRAIKLEHGEEVPSDINAFFGHPLTAATNVINGDASQTLSMALLHEYKNLPPIVENEIRAVNSGSRAPTPPAENEKSELLLLHGSNVENFFHPENISEEEYLLYRQEQDALSVAQLNAAENHHIEAGEQIRRALSEKIMRRKYLQGTIHKDDHDINSETTSPLRKALNTRPILPPLHSTMAATWNNNYHLQPPPLYNANLGVNQGYATMELPHDKNAHYQNIPKTQYYEMRTVASHHDSNQPSPVNLTTATNTMTTIDYGHHSDNHLQHHHQNSLSVDSGISDSCVTSPQQHSPHVSECPPPLYSADQHRSSRSKRRSSVDSDEYVADEDLIAKRIPDPTGLLFNLEAPTSVFQKIEEDRVTYINKGQYYNLALEFYPNRRMIPVPFRNETLKSVVLIVLRGDKMTTDDTTAWNFWYGRQHNAKQRVLELDTKNSSGIITDSITEISSNAFSFHWRPSEIAKISIAAQCLSTDFSNQKGVKGMPLHLQIDTFEDERDMLPIHRAYCQIKAFCDKGAERKTRDEQRRREAKLKMLETSGYQKKKLFQIHPPCERTELYSMFDIESRPFLFFGHHVPIAQLFCAPPSTAIQPQPPPTRAVMMPPNMHNFEDQAPPAKIPKYDGEQVLIYVRRKDETVYTALVLQKPTTDGLKEAIEEKFKIPASSIKNINKYSSRGIIVKVDDDVIRHYPNESIFEIEIQTTDEAGYVITLGEIVPDYSANTKR